MTHNDKEHLWNFLAKTERQEDISTIYNAILNFLYCADDEQYWLDKGWRKIREQAEKLGFIN